MVKKLFIFLVSSCFIFLNGLSQSTLKVNAKQVNFGIVLAGESLVSKRISFTRSNFTDSLIVSTPTNFFISKDNISYNTSIIFSRKEMQSGGALGIYLKFSPSIANEIYTGNLNFASPALANALLVPLVGNSYPKSTTLNVVNWNLEWFGSPVNGPDDNDLQEDNVHKIMDSLNADLYTLCEIVDTARFGHLCRSIRGDYGYFVSDFCSLATNPVGNNYATGQKLGFFYRKKMFSNLSVRGLMRKNASNHAYHDWASGRFPYLLEADVTINNNMKHLSFILIHAKSGDTPDDYARRESGVKELKDTMDTYMKSKNIILLGDYNDDLLKTICWSCSTDTSSFNEIVKDSTDDNSYISVTLPLTKLGIASTQYPNIIDNVIISNEMKSDYLPYSIHVVNEVTDWVNNYINTTTDHYPVWSRYKFNSVETPDTSISENFSFYPNPASNFIKIKFLTPFKKVYLQLFNAEGKLLQVKEWSEVRRNEIKDLNISALPKGLYILHLFNSELNISKKIIIE